MGLTIAIVKETAAHEKRVAITPETVKKYIGLGCKVIIEKGAGAGASIPDGAYKDAGATIAASSETLLKGSNIILSVQAPSAKLLSSAPKDSVMIGMFSPYSDPKLIDAFAKSKVTAFSMELVPRISRAQSMDVLSSQSNLAGYKSVLDAAEHFASAFPMMMTAAGTVPPAKVLVMGAGVAGLQAIATAKRLGAVVSATDVRPAAKEQVESLGGKFIAVEDEEFKQAETSGGYAKEMSTAYQKKQQALIEATVPKQDIVITTALIPGRAAPKLITKAMVNSMKPGSVIVDLAVESGGNCELSQAGEVVKAHDVSVIGHYNVPSRLASDASALYARNLFNLVQLIVKDGALTIDEEDEIIKGITLTRAGKIVHPNFKSTAKKAPTQKSSTKKTTAKKKSTAAPAKKKTTQKKSATATSKAEKVENQDQKTNKQDQA